MHLIVATVSNGLMDQPTTCVGLDLTYSAEKPGSRPSTVSLDLIIAVVAQKFSFIIIDNCVVTAPTGKAVSRSEPARSA